MDVERLIKHGSYQDIAMSAMKGDPEAALINVRRTRNMTNYYLADEPKESGTQLAGAFDAVNQAFGNSPFGEDDAVRAITTVMDVDDSTAKSLFTKLVAGVHITPASTPAQRYRQVDINVPATTSMNLLPDNYPSIWD